MPQVDKKKTLNDIVAYRKKRKAKARILRLCMFLLLVTGISLIWFNAGTIFEPLRGIASKIETKTSDEIGFPVQLPGSAIYRFNSFGDSFTLLTDTYLYAYNSNGGQVYASRHGYTNPVQRTNDKRVLVYDKGSYKFSLYNRTSMIFEHTLEDKIVYGNISSGDYSAIVTDSLMYSNVIYIYDGNGNWKYTRKFVDENVMQVVFSKDTQYMFVTTIGAESGEIVSNIYKFNLNEIGDASWQYKLTGNSISCKIYSLEQRFIAVYDNICISIDAVTGELISSYSFNGTLLFPSASNQLIALLISEYSTNKVVLVTLDLDCGFIASRPVSVNAVGIIAENDNIYELEGNILYQFDQELNTVNFIELQDEYSAFIKNGQDFFMLGYDVVEKERFLY